MKKILLLLFLFPIMASAQVSDDFSDSDFLSNPAWAGDTGDFKISTYSSSTWSLRPRLQLDGTVADISHLYLATPLASLDNVEWNFWIRLAFNTSSTNNARVYLVSDNSNLEASLNGYYVMFGDDGSDALDSISLWKQSGLSTQKLIAGHIAFTGASRNYRIKVTRDDTGLWTLMADTLGTNNPLLEGSAVDLTHTSSSYFGVYCKYTLTNKTNFYFDDIYVGPEIVDTIPPQISTLDVLSQTQLDIYFSENVETSSAENTLNYNVNGIGNPLSAVKDLTMAHLVHLSFAGSFVPGQLYTLNVENVSDPALNVMDPASVDFSYYIPLSYDVVFNEIMADPDPAVGLPNYEYLELANNKNIPLSLKNWILEIGSSSLVMPDIYIPADSFLILCSEEAAPIMGTFGPCAGFGSFSLTNTGTSLILKTPGGSIIHQVTYSDAWYADPSKDDGGWSIEQIDPANPCGGQQNWKASTAMLGGSPGSRNSVFASNPDLIPPFISDVIPLSTNRLKVIFNEELAAEIVENTGAWVADNGVGSPLTATVTGSLSAELEFSMAFQNNIIYQLIYTDTLRDCVGNMTMGDTAHFSLFQPAQFDILINEIMADPEPVVGLPAYEYLELFNRSAFPVSLRKWKLGMGTSIKEFPEVSIPANAYLILCPPGTETQFSVYGKSAPLSGLSLTNTGTSLILMDSLFRTISGVTYSDSWYQNSVKDDGGWSLEQIDPANPCGQGANWKVSSDVKGGTPGQINSVIASNPDVSIPVLMRASVNRFETSKVRLFFNETLDSTSVLGTNKYQIDNGIGQPIQVRTVPYEFNSVILSLAAPLQTGVTYLLTITDTLVDCAGNMLPLQSSVKFAIPEIADSGDLVINEVLSNPTEYGVDYVEVYNRSSRVFNLAELNLAAYDTLSAAVTALYPMSTDGFLIFPGDYVALTTDPDKVRTLYRTPNPNGFSAMSSFPSLNNDDGVVAISNGFMEVLDWMKYDADMHYPLLNNTDGISLERISYNRPSLDRTNWHSAAESVGFGTPAYKNSQYSESEEDDGAIAVSPEIFSPDNDGYNDVLNISYQFDTPGYAANVVIYDANGRKIRELINNELLGTSGVFSWDGFTQEREKANIGIYVIQVEVFDTKGDVKRYKRAAVLAGRQN